MASVPPLKFPRTRHLMDTGSMTRDDLVLDSHEAKLLIQSGVICGRGMDQSKPCGASIWD